MMRGLEIGPDPGGGARAGRGRAAFEDALRYAQEREAFGKPIWQHQSIGNYLADMATKLHRRAAAHAVRGRALRRRASAATSRRAWPSCSRPRRPCEIALNAVRIHGGYGYSTEFDVERYFRDAPLMIVGEGTNEIQRNVIVKQLVERNRI